jgi:hypothetical protein
MFHSSSQIRQPLASIKVSYARHYYSLIVRWQSKRCDRSQDQPTAKTEPAPTFNVSHPEAMREPWQATSAPRYACSLQRSAAGEMPSIAGVGYGLAKAINAPTAGGMVALEGVVEIQAALAVRRQLLERGWSRRRIATEWGNFRHTVSQWTVELAVQPWREALRLASDCCVQGGRAGETAGTAPPASTTDKNQRNQSRKP